MAVTVTDNRTIVNEADSLTGWTANADSLFNSQPDPVEATNSIGTQVSNETQQVYFTAGASSNLTNTLFYAWALPGGVLDTAGNGGVALILGDGTTTRAYHVGGSDVAGFRHSDGPVFWQCFVIDTGSLPTVTTQVNGTGDPTFSAITQYGVQYKTLAKSVGGVENCFTDIMRFGNGGITITTGTSGDPGLFSQIANTDRQTGNQQAYGIFRSLGSGLFGAQGPLTFGDNAGTTSTYFEDTNASIVFEDRGFATDKYGITVQGNATGTTTFILGTRGGVGLGSEGCTITAATGVGAFFTASDADLQILGLYGCSLNGISQGITFSSDATNAPNHEIFATTFSGCGQIAIGLTEFKNNSIIGSVGTAATLISDTTNVTDLEFISGGTGHAILIDTPGTYDFNNFTYEGYAATDGTTGNEVVYNNSGGAVTINVSGGNTPTVRNGTGATTTVNATVNLTLTGMKDNTEVRVYSSEDNTAPYTAPTELAGIENATDGTTDNRSFTFSATPDTTIFIRIFNTNWIADDIELLVPGTSQSIPVAQRRDRVFSNP